MIIQGGGWDGRPNKGGGKDEAQGKEIQSYHDGCGRYEENSWHIVYSFSPKGRQHLLLQQWEGSGFLYRSVITSIIVSHLNMFILNSLKCSPGYFAAFDAMYNLVPDSSSSIFYEFEWSHLWGMEASGIPVWRKQRIKAARPVKIWSSFVYYRQDLTASWIKLSWEHNVPLKCQECARVASRHVPFTSRRAEYCAFVRLRRRLRQNSNYSGRRLWLLRVTQISNLTTDCWLISHSSAHAYRKNK